MPLALGLVSYFKYEKRDNLTKKITRYTFSLLLSKSAPQERALLVHFGLIVCLFVCFSFCIFLYIQTNISLRMPQFIYINSR